MSIQAVCELGEAGKPCGASADFKPSGVSGFVTLLESGDTTTITYKVVGLKPGLHGFHIHEKADFSNGCISAGGHFNPHGKMHGDVTDEERHAGDLGNIEANSEGVSEGTLTVTTHYISLTAGAACVVGRSFMVHADPDDLGKGDNSEPGPPPVNGKCSFVTGNAGARLACGEIKLA